jgi:ankyrin repeat protein
MLVVVVLVVVMLVVVCNTMGSSASTEQHNRQLYEGVRRGDIAQVKQLVVQRADVNAGISSDQYTSLDFACSNGHQEIVDILLEHAADVNQSNRFGNTPLHGASITGHRAIVASLIRHAADVNQGNQSGNTALHWASNRGCYEVVMQLINHAANVNQCQNRGYTPLHEACRVGHRAVVNILINHAANVNQCSNYGITPLHEASHNGHQELAMRLIDQGADINIKNVCAAISHHAMAHSLSNYALVLTNPLHHRPETKLQSTWHIHHNLHKQSSANVCVPPSCQVRCSTLVVPINLPNQPTRIPLLCLCVGLWGCRQQPTRMAGQPTSPIATTCATSSHSYDDDPTDSRPSTISSVDDDAERTDVLDLLVSAVLVVIVADGDVMIASDISHINTACATTIQSH